MVQWNEGSFFEFWGCVFEVFYFFFEVFFCFKGFSVIVPIIILDYKS
jgi:hypothetical protein